MVHLLALLGVLSISFSAIFVRLAGASPVTATFYRGAYAAPVLLVIWLAQKSQDRRGRRERWLAIVSGLLLALDLNLWHESIALLGAGLGTVIANAQVVFVAAAAWVLYGERPTIARIATILIVLGGVVLTSGLARHDAYGAAPVTGAIVGMLAAVTYAAFLLVYREANRTPGPRSGPLLDSTLGMIAGALASRGVRSALHLHARPGREPVAGAAGDRLAGDRLAADRHGAAEAAGGGDVGAAARPAGVHGDLGRAAVRRAALGRCSGPARRSSSPASACCRSSGK